MFAKLKQKIQEEGVDLSKGFANGPLGNNLSSSSKRGSGETTPSQSATSPVASRRAKHADSNSDNAVSNTESKLRINRNPITGETHTDNNRSTAFQASDYEASITDFSIGDSPSALLRKPVEQQDDAESKVKHLSKALNEEIKHREKLEQMLEKCRESLSKKSEERDQEWRKKFENLEKDYGVLSAKLSQANVWRDKYIRDHEAAEELEDFQTQEVAKVKHLLLISQQEIQDIENKLKDTQSELLIAKQSLASLEQESERLKWKCNKFEEECNILKEQAKRDEDVVNELRSSKDSLGKKVMECTWQIEENEAKYNKQEMQLSSLNNDYATLKHTHEVHLAKSNSALEEKTNTVEHLEDRVKTLERRLCDSDLGEDEKLKALTLERDSLEAKLEESRQHLNEIKTGWSEQINCLERQISNLNQKMAEDREDAAKIEEQVQAGKSRLEQQIVELQQQLEESLNSNRQLSDALERSEVKCKRQKTDLRAEVDQAYKDKEDAAKLLEERIKGLELRIANMETERNDETTKFHSKIAQLESRNTEHLGKENDLEKQINRLIEEKGKAEKKCEALEMEISDQASTKNSLSNEILALNDKVTNLEAQLEVKTATETATIAEFKKLEGERQSTELERQELAVKSETLAKEIVCLKEEVEKHQRINESSSSENQQRVQELQQDLEDALKDNEKLRETITHLETSLDDNHIEKSERVRGLKTLVADLENQLLDRSKTIKLQQQRLGDIKKTLQRELKFQTPGEATNGESVDKDALASFNAAMSKGGVDMSVVHFGHGRPTSLADKLGDINFRYIKHVIIKFMTGHDYESQQLIKAIGVLLEFTSEEERLVRETLEWRTSWFGSKPQLSRPHVGNRTVMS